MAADLTRAVCIAVNCVQDVIKTPITEAHEFG